ncbi:MAG: DUF2935 domain-containing protein [Lachnospiraceae bacterium]
MKRYVTLSLETHLFFSRIMKEHALFLLAAFPAKEKEYRKKADWFREEFENLLSFAVKLTDGMIQDSVLQSGEIVTKFTEMAESQTRKLTGIPINTEITQAEKKLKEGCLIRINREKVRQIRRINKRALWLLNGFIAFKEKILQDVLSCKLYTSNYPLLIEHILREAKLYRQILMEIGQRGCMPSQDMKTMEIFWNQIMMEHAQFIRGLLDPTECELIEKADGFAKDYCELLEKAKKQDCRAMDGLTEKTLKKTMQYRNFKAAGTEGITDCQIRSVILPLLADHVLREANHYLRILGKESES